VERGGKVSDKTRRQEWIDSYRKDWMTDDQWECYQFLADLFFGFNHLFGKVHNNRETHP